MKIRDLFLVIVLLSIVVNSAIIIGFTSSKIKTISDATSKTSSDQLITNSKDNMATIAVGLRDSLDSQLQCQYQLVKSWAVVPTLTETAKDAQAYTKEQLYEMWSAELTRVYDEGEAIGDGNLANDLNPTASIFLKTLSDNTGTYPEIFITDNRGYAIAANVATGDFDQGPSDWRVFLDETTQKPYFKQNKPGANQEPWYYAANQAPDGFYISGTIFDESSKTWGLELVSQMKDPTTDAYLGQIKAVFDFSKFVKGFVNSEELNVDEVQIIDSAGQIIADSDDEASDSTELELTKVDNVLMDEIKKGKTSGVVIMTDDEGTRVMTSYAVSNEKNKYIIAVSKKYSDVEGPITNFVAGLKQNIDNEGKSLTSSIIVVALIIGLLTLLAAISIINMRVSKPLNKLKNVSDKLSQGEIAGLEVDVSGKDEIGQLGEGFKGILAAFKLLKEEAEGKAKSETKPKSEATPKTETKPKRK